MVSTVRMSLGAVLGIALCLGATAETARAQTSGSISAETSNVSQPMQADWIGCAVFFHGKAQECSLSGLQVPVTGVARVSGMVNNVKNLADVAGTYKVVGVDDTFGGGHLKLKNDKGVTMTLWPFAASIEGSIDPNTVLQVGSDGMKLELKKK
jgi:hypothetical protein